MLTFSCTKKEFDFEKFTSEWKCSLKNCKKRNSFFCETNLKIDGGWSSWTETSSCTKSCGNGTKLFTRKCTSPKPQYFGKNCSGPTEKRELCNLGDCPVDGGWTSWSQFLSCSKSCGTGIQIFHRKCSNPLPRNGGHNCDGDNVYYSECNLGDCPVDGGWTEWTSYPCSRSCGKGTKRRTRECSQPQPQNGGKDCPGVSMMMEDCSEQECSRDVTIENMQGTLIDFVLPCYQNSWIIDCNPYDFNKAFLFLIDQNGNFLEYVDGNLVAVKPSIKRMNQLSTIMTREHNPNYLFQIIWCNDHGGFHIQSGNGVFVGIKEVSNTFQLDFITNKKLLTKKFVWKLTIIKSLFLNIESIEFVNNFLDIDSREAHITQNSGENFTGLKTTFMDKKFLSLIKARIEPTLEKEGLEYGDVVINYSNRNGDNMNGYICDYKWDLYDAITVCRHLGHLTGLPTYNGQFSSRVKYPNYVMTGVRCEEGSDSFLECQSKQVQNDYENFVQNAIESGHGFGCNDGIRTDVAGVVCGNNYQIKSLKNNASDAINDLHLTHYFVNKLQETTASGIIDYICTSIIPFFYSNNKRLV